MNSVRNDVYFRSTNTPFQQFSLAYYSKVLYISWSNLLANHSYIILTKHIGRG